MMKGFCEGFKKAITTMDYKPINDFYSGLLELQKTKGRLFIIGVGGSAINAQHWAVDIRKFTGIETHTMDNVGEITALTNDNGFETIFETWLKVNRLSGKDALLILSVGGGNAEHRVSINLIKAILYAKSVETPIIGIVSRDGGYTKKMADICILVPVIHEGLTTAFAEIMQVFILHLLVTRLEIKICETKWGEIDLK